MACRSTRVCGVESINKGMELTMLLRFIGALIVLSGAVVSIVTLAVSGKIDSGLVGLVLSYALK